MKSFTAKEFSRCPAKVYEAAREDGEVEITHDRFVGSFHIVHIKSDYDASTFHHECREKLSDIFIGEFYGNKKAPD